MWKPNANNIITVEQKQAEALAGVQAAFQSAIEQLVAATAKSRNYSSGETLASYALSTNPAWAAEAQAFIEWRDKVWAHAYGELEKALTGQRAIPQVEAFLKELPEIDWPPAPSGT